MSDVYQVALTLHAMHPDDRAWVLSQLSSAEKNAIGALVGHNGSQPIEEVHEFDLAVAREALHYRSVPDTVSQLSALDAAQIARVLEHEPDWVVAGVIEAYRWPWQIAALDLLGLERKKNIALLGNRVFRPKLIESLLQKLYARACVVTARSFPTEASVQPFPSPKRSTWLRLEGIKRWLL